MPPVHSGEPDPGPSQEAEVVMTGDSTYTDEDVEKHLDTLSDHRLRAAFLREEMQDLGGRYG